MDDRTTTSSGGNATRRRWRSYILLAGAIAVVVQMQASFSMVGSRYINSISNEAQVIWTSLSTSATTTMFSKRTSSEGIFGYYDVEDEEINGSNTHMDSEAIGQTMQGILSAKSFEYFHHIRQEIDASDHNERCERYGFTYNKTGVPKQRRIFYGALVADEPNELLDIVSTETHGLYHAMVLVEANRTQNLTPRKLKRPRHHRFLSHLFGIGNTSNIQVRLFVDENPRLREMDREQMQRSEISKGWKELGLGDEPDDVALLGDLDEVFSRDFLQAIRVCDVPELEYENGRCSREKTGIRGQVAIYESSPECLIDGAFWWHPDFIPAALCGRDRECRVARYTTARVFSCQQH